MKTLDHDTKQLSSQHLAVNGGKKIRTTPMPARRLFDEDDKRAVMDLFDQAIEEGSHIIGYGGPKEEAYCKAFCEFMGGGFADGVNSGTNAVYVALRAMELEPYSEVIVPPVSDPGGIMPVVMCQLIPVPADCEPDFFNIDPASIEEKITPRTAAIVVAHISGRPADMDAIMAIAQRHNLKVIEDCAQAHGARYKGRAVGSIGHVAAFSTMFGKHHACGGQGGLVYSRDESTYWKIRRHADRGKPWGVENPTGNVGADLNCNMDEMHAALGVSQMRKLPGHLNHIRKLARRLADGIRPLQAVHMVDDPPNCEGSFWFIVLRFDKRKLPIDKATFIEALNAEGILFSDTYMHSPVAWPWFEQRAAFGTSQLPWRHPDQKASTPNQLELPRLLAVDRDHFSVKIHEGYSIQDVDDIVAVLAKVESAFA